MPLENASNLTAKPPLRIAVLMPCYNEAATIAQVVHGFKTNLPSATVYVYDNNSSDQSAERAAAAGAVVRNERHQGKGHVARRMFADIDADVYVMVDGDATYDPTAAPDAVAELVHRRLDFINIARRTANPEAYRSGHQMGNALLTGLVALLFGRQFTDMLSGYKLFSRRFVKSFPALSTGFEIETELTIHALELTMPVAERIATYSQRPTGSISKLSTVRDGLRILRTIVRLTKNERPFAFFGTIGLMFICIAIAFGRSALADIPRDGPGPAPSDRSVGRRLGSDGRAEHYRWNHSRQCHH